MSAEMEAMIRKILEEVQKGGAAPVVSATTTSANP